MARGRRADDSMTTFWRHWGAVLERVIEGLICAEFVVRDPTVAQHGLSNCLICDLLGFFLVRHGITKPWSACAGSADRFGAGVCGAGGSRSPERRLEVLRQYLAAGAQGDAAPSCESSIARHQGRGFRPAGTHRSLHAASQVALSGRTAWRVERPRAKLPARGLPGWLPSWFARGHKHVSIWKQIVDNQNTLLTIVGLVTGAVFSVETLLRGRRDAERAQRDSERAQREAERAQRDSERAQRESKEGRIQAAVDGMMQPFPPQKKEAEVAERGITKAIRSRILHWNQHATIIAGRFGSGKSVALEEALRGMQGVYVHIVKDKDWEKSLYYDLGLDNLDMLKNVLRLVRKRNQESPPILVLDIPRTTKEGATSATLVVLCLIRLGAGMDTVSTFAKILSSDSSLAHAGTRRLSRPVSLCCGRVLCKLCEQGFFRGDRVRLLGRHGHRLRCRWSGTSGQLLGRRPDRGRGQGIAEPPRAQGQNGRIP